MSHLTMSTELMRATARDAFWTAYRDTPFMFDGILHGTTSDSDQEIYPWLGSAPSPQEMIGSRQRKAVPAFDWTIVNKLWESTITVPYKLRRFGKISAVSNLIADLGRKARLWPTQLSSDLIRDGHTTLCYDGQNFYDVDHTDPGARYQTNQDNDLQSSASDTAAPTDIEFKNAVQAVIGALFGFKDNEGDPFWPADSVAGLDLAILVPTDYIEVAEAVASVELLTGSVSNPVKGKFSVLPNPYFALAGTTPVIFGFCRSHPQKAVISQVADDLELSDSMGGDNEFNTKDVDFGTFQLSNVGYGQWRTTVRCEFV